MWSRARVVRWDAEAEPTTQDDDLAVEEPLEIRVGGEAVSVTMRTPGPIGDSWDQQDRELAAGFLLTERVIAGPEAILRIDPCLKAPDGNVINVHLATGVTLDTERLRRNVYTASSCGVCGKASIDTVHQHFPPINNSPDAEPARVTDAVLLSLPQRLRESQTTFTRTGGLHAAGLFDLEGNLLAIREDIGRHNAVDKVIGFAVLSGRLPLDRAILFVSGRASFEIMQKSLAARIPVVAAVSAPSSLTVEFARDSGQTLVGFLRPPRMNVYTHGERIVPA
ncbi:MAG: formate dehydrogenase accessory sulfurtransferase FdhD [Planctomycetota bacterium]